VMYAVSGLPEKEALVLPQDSETRARTVASQLSSPTLALRGRAVRSLRHLPVTDVAHLERMVVNLEGTNRTFVELYLRSVQAPPEPAIDVVVENGGKTLRVVQLQDASVRVETPGATTPKVYLGYNLLDFRLRNPVVAQQLNLRGVDGRFTVADMQLVAPAVESRPAAFVPAVVWSAPASESGGFVEALSVQAALATCARAGRSAEESERTALAVMHRVQASTAAEERTVRADPALVKRYLVEYRRADATRLALTREQVQDRLAALERQVLEMQLRIDCVRKAMVALECQEKPR
ncbi:MAG TPA: hypothetical protein VJU16_09315, partial [Planctomycetota bacterium]|nr:hypothetical protein [Planctomycetota bacterium]